MKHVLVLLLLLLLSACNAVPMTHGQWLAEQKKRQEYEKAGVEYKSRSQIKAEAVETRKAVDDVKFAKH